VIRFCNPLTDFIPSEVEGRKAVVRPSTSLGMKNLFALHVLDA